MCDMCARDRIELVCENILLLAHTREHLRSLDPRDLLVAHCVTIARRYEWLDNAADASALAASVKAFCDLYWYTHIPLFTMDADNNQYLHVGNFSAM